MITFINPPKTSTPNESGVTSSKINSAVFSPPVSLKIAA